MAPIRCVYASTQLRTERTVRVADRGREGAAIGKSCTESRIDTIVSMCCDTGVAMCQRGNVTAGKRYCCVIVSELEWDFLLIP